MSINPDICAHALGYAAERLAATEDAEMRGLFRKMGGVAFVRRDDGTILIFDAHGRERVVHPPRPKWPRWHCERGQNWRPRVGDVPKEAEQV